MNVSYLFASEYVLPSFMVGCVGAAPTRTYKCRDFDPQGSAAAHLARHRR